MALILAVSAFSLFLVTAHAPTAALNNASVERIRLLADSCARQLTGWEKSIEKLPFNGRRHMPEQEKQKREADQKAREFKLTFLRNLSPTHPLYNSAEAREARGEPPEN